MMALAEDSMAVLLSAIITAVIGRTLVSRHKYNLEPAPRSSNTVDGDVDLLFEGSLFGLV